MKIKTGFNLLPASYMVFITIFFVLAWVSSDNLQKNIKNLIDGSITAQGQLERSYQHVVVAAQYLRMSSYYGDAIDYIDASRSEFDSFQRSYLDYFKDRPGAKEQVQKIRMTAEHAWQTMEKSVDVLKSGGSLGVEVPQAVVAFGNELDDLRTEFLVEYRRVLHEMDQNRRTEAIVYAVGIVLLIILTIWIFRMMRSHFFRPINRLSAHIEQMAKGDFTVTLDDRVKNELGAIYDSLRKMQESVSLIIREVHQSIGEVSKNSDLITAGSADLSVRTEQQSAALSETASSMQELSSTVMQNADNARQANELASGAHTVATKGGQIMDDVINRMSSIASHSVKISDIVNMIESIAFQTNILALNAAVEAARAGEQGKGFAVVAGEVRNLASRSADAAKEIKTLIESAVSDVHSGNKLVEEAGKTMEEIVTSVSRVAGIMGEISAATNEQSRGIGQINQAVSQMDEVTHRNALLVQETTLTASYLKSSVERVNQAISLLKVGDLQESNASSKALATAKKKAAAAKAAAAAQEFDEEQEQQPAKESKKSRKADKDAALAKPAEKTASTGSDSKEHEIVSPLKKNSTSTEGEWETF